MAWTRLATKTQTTAGNTLTTDTFTASKFNQLLAHHINNGSIDPTLRLGKTTIDTNQNYARRYSGNGLGDVTNISQTYIGLDYDGGAHTMFDVGFIVNISSEEKLILDWNVEAKTAGAGYVPSRMEHAGKWVNSNQFDLVQISEISSGTLDVDSNLMVIGSDGTPSSLTWQNGLEFHETDTNKDYVWNSSTNAWIQIT